MITITIPTHNSAMTIMKCLEAVARQNIKLKIHIMDNQSTDGTYEMVQAMIKNKWFGEIEIKLTQSVDMKRTKNIPLMRYKLSQETDTEFIMFLDDDVVIPPHSIEKMIEDFKTDTGMLGMCYEPYVDHVQMGATIMRTDIAKKINWKIDEDCECKNCAKDLIDMGLKVEKFTKTNARHLKFL